MNNSNRIIIKNTVFLYVRMLLVLAVTLYTARVVLNTLGVVDYGIYNIIGGIVALTTILTNTMSTACQRFFSYEIGLNNDKGFQELYSISLILFTVLSFLIFVIGGLVGNNLINDFLNIPDERKQAALWVWYLSVIATCFNIIRIPYNAIILSYEKMSFFAFLSIIESMLKLIIVFFLLSVRFDKLIIYAFLTLIVIVIISYCYYSYCKKNFSNCKFKFIPLSRGSDILSFSAWSFWGSLTSVGIDQGINILMNLFFGPAVNASRGIAIQVKNTMANFVSNFQVASNPRVVKLYANDSKDEMNRLIFQSSKLSYYLMLFFSLPFLFESSYLMSLWLNNVPEYALTFARLEVILALVGCLSGTTGQAINATGQIKQYQIIISIMLSLSFFVSWILFNYGYPPQSAILVGIVFAGILPLFAKMFLIKRLLGITISLYLKKVLVPEFLVTALSVIFLKIMYSIYEAYSLWEHFVMISICAIIPLLSIMLLGLSKSEKQFVLSFISKKLNKVI